MKYFTLVIVCSFITTCIITAGSYYKQRKEFNYNSKAMQLGFILRFTIYQSIFKLQ